MYICFLPTWQCISIKNTVLIPTSSSIRNLDWRLSGGTHSPVFEIFFFEEESVSLISVECHLQLYDHYRIFRCSLMRVHSMGSGDFRSHTYASRMENSDAYSHFHYTFTVYRHNPDTRRWIIKTLRWYAERWTAAHSCFPAKLRSTYWNQARLLPYTRYGITTLSSR